MANAFTSTTSWDLLTETAYDRAVSFYLRDEPQWRQVIDKRPERQAMPGDVVVLTIHNTPMALTTAPLSELVDPDAVAPAAPTRVPVTMNEYGNASLWTLKLQQLAFTNPDAELARLIGFNMVDSVDSIIRSVADTSTNVMRVNAGKAITTGGTDNAIVATDVLLRNPATTAVSLLQRGKVMPKQSGKYVAMIHPDVAYDLQAENSATAWNAPHTVGGDTAAIYSGVIGDFQGARYIETTRITAANNTAATPVKVYNTYFLGREALVEATAVDPHIVIGPQTDKLKRYFPIGWYCLFGHALYRPEAMILAKSASSLSTL